MKESVCSLKIFYLQPYCQLLRLRLGERHHILQYYLHVFLAQQSLWMVKAKNSQSLQEHDQTAATQPENRLAHIPRKLSRPHLTT